ncbi:exported hypothetical protein [Candidatus Nitrospira nitrificans]|uniref:Uncharacterized protein n=1 Tax=Candidatus Nitrospira nitrificans TaxID=1742973 RepID=A0A0S4L9R3_9BACT|nr:exported hypothetical protein [Candidatus Nitrospira nitrificans]
MKRNHRSRVLAAVVVDSVVAAVESAIAGKRLALIKTLKDLRPRPLLYKGITRRGPEVLLKTGSQIGPTATLKSLHSDWRHQYHPE